MTQQRNNKSVFYLHARICVCCTHVPVFMYLCAHTRVYVCFVFVDGLDPGVISYRSVKYDRSVECSPENKGVRF